MKRIFLLSFSFLLFLNTNANSSPQTYAFQPRWLALGHYKKNLFGHYKSVVSSPDFFLAADGIDSPLAELEATMAAMASPVGENPNLHAQCRFPARLDWLKTMGLVDTKALPKLKCPNYDLFTYNHAVESISLIFATGYLSNPASYFGHPLIKFNLPRDKVATHLLDVSVNYGAVTPPDENPFVYAMKGLFGGYHATFSNRQFYYNNHAYGELELRDMWEYRLNLTADEVKHLVAHTWEVLGQSFPYYFLSDNCASAVGELLEEILDVTLVPKYLPYSFPFTVFDNLMSQTRKNGTALVTAVTLVPSRQTRLTKRYALLNKDEKRAMTSVAESGVRTPSYQALPPERKARVIEALFDYYSFRTVADSGKENFKELKRELLVDRLALPASGSAENLSYELKPPHEGQRPMLTRFSVFDSNGLGTGGEI